MEVDLNLQEQLILFQLMSDAIDDIVIKTDCDGIIRYASPAEGPLGSLLPDDQTGPHILELAAEPFRPAIAEALQGALGGRNSRQWLEFRSPRAEDKNQWFSIRLGALKDDHGAVTGTLGIVRDQREVKHLEEQLFRAELTDPLTGLTNRQAWMEMLNHLIEAQSPACLAMIDIDHFKAINLHYGISSGDKVLIAFADFLRSQTPSGISISRVGGSRFGMLFPGWSRCRCFPDARQSSAAIWEMRIWVRLFWMLWQQSSKLTRRLYIVVTLLWGMLRLAFMCAITFQPL